jgi:hypothetical protein
MTNATTMTEPRQNVLYGISSALRDNTHHRLHNISYTKPNQYLWVETNPEGVATIRKFINPTNKTTDTSTMTDYSYSALNSLMMDIKNRKIDPNKVLWPELQDSSISRNKPGIIQFPEDPDPFN